MKMFRIGDKVKIVNDGKRYERYGSWFNENGYSDVLKHEYENTHQYNDSQDLIGQVVATGKNRECSTDMYAVRLNTGGLILIGESGLKLDANVQSNTSKQSLKLFELFEHYKTPLNVGDRFVGENGEIYHFDGCYIYEDGTELTEAKHSLNILNDEVYPYDDTKEMTIEEIQEALGHRVKIVE